MNAYLRGIYTLEKLREIYEDYQSKEEDWRCSGWYSSFLTGQFALHKVISDIEGGRHGTFCCKALENPF